MPLGWGHDGGDPVTWAVADIGDQTGRTFVVTGSTSGIGRHTALELARHLSLIHI